MTGCMDEGTGPLTLSWASRLAPAANRAAAARVAPAHAARCRAVSPEEGSYAFVSTPRPTSSSIKSAWLPCRARRDMSCWQSHCASRGAVFHMNNKKVNLKCHANKHIVMKRLRKTRTENEDESRQAMLQNEIT